MTPRAKTRDAALGVVSDGGFQDTLRREGVMLVAFVKEWSGSSHLLTHALSELAKEYGEMVFMATMDVEKNREVPRSLGVTEIPSLLFFRDGQLCDRIAGSAPRTAIVRAIEALLPVDRRHGRSSNPEGSTP